MSKESGGIDKVLEELQSPGDWAAAFIGGAGGAVVSTFLHWTDLGHSVPTGALGAIGARRAFMASFRKKFVLKKARALAELLEQEGLYEDLLVTMADHINKFHRGIISVSDLEKATSRNASIDTKRKKDRARLARP